MSVCLFFIVYCALLFPFTVHGENAGEAELVRARDLYYKGVEGDRTATKESTKLLEEVARRRPDDAMVTAYLASNRLLESGRTLALWKKNRLAKEGVLGLDRAVAMEPDNLEVRFVRAATLWELPAFFQRRRQAEADFAWLAPRVRAEVEAGRLERRLAAAALYRHGLALEQKGDRKGAAAAWKSAVELGPSTPGGAAAANKLK